MSTRIPSQLADLLLHPESVSYNRQFSELFTALPEEMSAPFSIFLTYMLNTVRATLPPALFSPDNIALRQNPRTLLTGIITNITILLGTVFTTVKFFVPPQNISDLFSQLFNAMNTGLYVNPSLDVPALMSSLSNSLSSVITSSLEAQPYSALTNFPYELYSMLNNTPPPVLHPSPFDFDSQLYQLLFDMVLDIVILVEELAGELLARERNENFALQGVYQFREGAETDPEKCSICLEEMKDGDIARRLRCLHDFHKDCIDRWLNTSTTCPMCRTQVSANH